MKYRIMKVVKSGYPLTPFPFKHLNNSGLHGVTYLTPLTPF